MLKRKKGHPKVAFSTLSSSASGELAGAEEERAFDGGVFVAV
jgi:hypothetical protein